MESFSNPTGSRRSHLYKFKETKLSIENGTSINQKQGVINKCPSCGGNLKAFATNCDLCGHELAGVKANRTVVDLAERFKAIETEVDQAGLTGGKRDSEIATRRGRVIRDFAIPNSREDLQSLIYFIHPKIQENLKPDPNAEDWRVKFKEVMTLAKNAYKGDAKTRAEFEEMERSLTTTLSGDLKTKAKRNPIVAIGILLVVIATLIGLASTQMDKWSQSKCLAKYEEGSAAEKARLDGIVASVVTLQESKKYSEALARLNLLRWEYKESCNEEDAQKQREGWEAKRKELASQLTIAESSDAAQKKELFEREEAEKADAQAKDAAKEKKATANKEW